VDSLEFADVPAMELATLYLLQLHTPQLQHMHIH